MTPLFKRATGDHPQVDVFNNIRDALTERTPLDGIDIEFERTPAGFRPLLRAPLGTASSAEFALFVVVAIFNDYYECRRLTPATATTFTLASDTVPVAKPNELRVTAWNNRTVSGITYTYVDAQTRNAVSSAGTTIEEITPRIRLEAASPPGPYGVATLGTIVAAVQMDTGLENVDWQDITGDHFYLPTAAGGLVIRTQVLGEAADTISTAYGNVQKPDTLKGYVRTRTRSVNGMAGSFDTTEEIDPPYTNAFIYIARVEGGGYVDINADGRRWMFRDETLRIATPLGVKLSAFKSFVDR